MSFSGDVEEEDDDHDVDLFSEAAKAEPEDDFNAAWEVLDLARAIYEKRMDEGDEVRLKVADTFIALGDVSLETGAFSISLLPPYSLPKHTPLFSPLRLRPAFTPTRPRALKR